MSYLVIGVGGTGAKLLQTLVHLSAAGLLPEPKRLLYILLVDPDQANGNVDECNQLAASYARCKQLDTGEESALFNQDVLVKGPWTPLKNMEVDTLDAIFMTTQRREGSNPEEADLLELLFSKEEREMSILQGFRGRPAIGATILANRISFTDPNDEWSKLLEQARGGDKFSSGVPVLLSGSVFGGSGAAGVPTILQLLKAPFSSKVSRLRLGLLLFLPYFKFKQLPDEVVQADPHAFALATTEALKYYDKRRFLDICSSIYTVGEQNPVDMAVSAVGAAAQRNEPHFVELVAGLGAVRFLGGGQLGAQPSVAIAGRAQEATLTWDDLPAADGPLGKGQLEKLRRMILFSVVFRLNFYRVMTEELSKRDTNIPLLRHFVVNEHLPKERALEELYHVNDYVGRFLHWLLRISTPRGGSCKPALVDVNVFAETDRATGEWQLRTNFRKDKDLHGLFLSLPVRRKPDVNDIWKNANVWNVTDASATGTGRLVRAIYDSCEL